MESSYWIVAAIAAVLIVPPTVVSINEVRMRRRHKANAGRRKQKMRL